MKYRLPLLVVFVFLGFVALAAARTWKSSDGRFTTDAELVAFKDGKVQLKKPDGKTIEVPLDSLGEEDRQFVRLQFPEAGKSGDSADDEGCREWKASIGKFRTRAKFLGVSGDRVRLRKPDGAEISVEKKLLSEDDQRWIDEQKGNGKLDPSSDEAPQSDKEIPAQTIDMKLVEFDLPKAAGRGAVGKLSDYVVRLCQPRTLYMSLTDPNAAAAFKRVVQKEPAYKAATPVRGTLAFGSRQYGFALDAKDSKAAGYDLLYFDGDGDGDLTNNEPISTSSTSKKGARSNANAPPLQFPRVHVTVKSDAESYEYAFFMNAIVNRAGSTEYLVVSVLPAAYREGTLVQGSKHTKVLLVDRNVNGRFDDAIAWNPGGGVGEGDILLVAPKPKASSGSVDRDQNYVAKIVPLYKRFYRLEVQPFGSALKLSPLQCSTGTVTQPKFGYHATLFNEEYGAIVAGGAKNQPFLLPEGKWKLGNYTIHDGADAGNRRTCLSAACGNGDASVVTVCKDKLAVLPLGEAYHAVVTASRAGDKGVSLSLAIVGAGGERCTNLLLKGTRGPKPHFVIKDQSDKVVKEGDFEYG